MLSLFIQLLDDVYISIKKIDPYDWFWVTYDVPGIFCAEY